MTAGIPQMTASTARRLRVRSARRAGVNSAESVFCKARVSRRLESVAITLMRQKPQNRKATTSSVLEGLVRMAMISKPESGASRLLSSIQVIQPRRQPVTTTFVLPELLKRTAPVLPEIIPVISGYSR